MSRSVAERGIAVVSVDYGLADNGRHFPVAHHDVSLKGATCPRSLVLVYPVLHDQLPPHRWSWPLDSAFPCFEPDSLRVWKAVAATVSLEPKLSGHGAVQPVSRRPAPS